VIWALQYLQAQGAASLSRGYTAARTGLCHGTGGNGYAFLKLYRRTGDAQWLDRARAFAMRGIEQTVYGTASAAEIAFRLSTSSSLISARN